MKTFSTLQDVQADDLPGWFKIKLWGVGPRYRVQILDDQDVTLIETTLFATVPVGMLSTWADSRGLRTPWAVKLQRAQALQHDVDSLVGAYLKGGNLRLEAVPVARAHRVTFVADAEPDPQISAVVGDFVHNCRSALDAIAFHLAVEQVLPSHPQVNLKRVYFPITKTEDEWTPAVKRVTAECWWTALPVDGSLRYALRSLQPWYSMSFAEPRHRITDEQRETAAGASLTMRLQTLSNMDKHQGLHVLVGGLDIFHWSENETWVAGPHRGPWRPGTVLGDLQTLGGRAPQVGSKFIVTFENDDPRRATSIVTEMGWLWQQTSQALRLLEVTAAESLVG